MQRNTYKIVAMAMVLAYAISILSFPVDAERQYSIELTGAELSGTIEFGPGSDVPVRDPFESGVVWLSNVEPVKAKWHIYDPGMHLVTTMEHVPSIKQRGSWQVDSRTFTWAFGDTASFTLPAFAAKGTWIAKCEYTMADGSTYSGSGLLGIPCTLPGDLIGNIFSYPWYLAGMKMPAIFWFPLIIFWAPALFILVCIVFTKSITGFVGVVRGAVSAGRKIRRART